MSRLAKTLFALVSVGLAGLMLATGAWLILKNTPKEAESHVRRLPPTAPRSIASRSPSSLSSREIYIGGVGITEPVGEATVIGSQLPGIVETVCVRPGDQIKTGTPLLKLDQRSAIADVAVAKAELAAQQAKLAELIGQIPTEQARFDAAFAIHEQAIASQANAQREFDRVQTVKNTFAITEEEIDTRRLNLEIAKGKAAETAARMAEAKAALQLLIGNPQAATLEVQKAAVLQAESNLQRAQTNLELRTILSPKDATVLSVRIRAGEFVPAAIVSNPYITLGVVDPLHIRVDIDESEIPRFSEGARAFASVRGRPEIQVPIEHVRTEPLVVPKRSLTGTVSERVDTRVLQVIYSADPKRLQASVGQQVDVYIEADKH